MLANISVKYETEIPQAIEKNGNGSETPQNEVRVGSYVQWTSDGQDQFLKPLRVAQIVKDDGGKEYAYVEGKQRSAIPMDQLTVQDPSQGDKKPLAPNPFYREDVESEGPFISFPLAGGNKLELRLMRRVSPKEFDRIKQLVDLSEDSLVAEDDDAGS